MSPSPETQLPAPQVLLRPTPPPSLPPQAMLFTSVLVVRLGLERGPWRQRKPKQVFSNSPPNNESHEMRNFFVFVLIGLNLVVACL